MKKIPYGGALVQSVEKEFSVHRLSVHVMPGGERADRWVDNHKWKLAHARALRMALEQPQIPDGTLLRIPDGHDPSAVRRALMELGVSDVDSIEAIEPTVVPLALD